VKHTNKKIFGQIYIPELNFFLMVLTEIVTLTFKTSAKLTGAYGLAVSGVMCLTSILFTGVLRYPQPNIIFEFNLMFDRYRYKTNWIWVSLYVLVFYTIDFAFLGANASKVPNGGWLPLVIGGVLAFIMLVS
jgi:KUP system potassium uptake protein